MSTPVPTVPSFEQSGALLATVVAITTYGKTPAQKVAAALVAQSVASIIQDAANGNAAAINTEVAALVGTISDPGLALVATTAAAIAAPYLQAFLAAEKAVPLIGAAESGILAAVAAGMNQAASAYINAPAAKT
jgi:hypothetical protein